MNYDSNKSRIVTAGRQFSGIALLLFVCCNVAVSQTKWSITDTIPLKNHSYYSTILTSWGNVCIAYVQEASFAADTAARMLKSTDGGKTWTAMRHVPYGGAQRAITSIQLVDSVNIIAVGQQGLILRSRDGGESWIQEESPVKSLFEQVHCASPSEGIIVGVAPLSILSYEEGHWVQKSFHPDCYIGPVTNQWTDSLGMHWKDSTDYHGMICCHSYGNGKFRVFCNGYYSDSLKTTLSPLYSTSDNWKSVDSVFVPFWPSQDAYRHLTIYNGYIGCLFGASDTMIVYGMASSNGGPSTGILCRSMDGGKQWIRIGDSANPHGFINMSPVSGTCMFSSVRDRATHSVGSLRLLRSTNLGDTWSYDTMLFDQTIDPVDLGYLFIPSFAIAGNSVIGAFYTSGLDSQNRIVGTSTFLARMELPAASIVVPPDHTLETLYPNPARNSVTVSSNATLILDALGRAYTVPNYDGTLDVSSLPAGVYYVSDAKQRARFVKE